MIGLIDSAAVYTADATGAFTVVVLAALPCRLALVSSDSGPTGDARSELASRRRLLWGPDYAMPEAVQLEVAGEKWNVEAGTLAAVRGVNGSVVYRRAEVVRAV